MGWFRRNKPEPQPEPEPLVDARPQAREFWRWWQTNLGDINAALGDREPQRFEFELTEAVAQMHPDLQFSVDRGERAVYALVVSGQEDPKLRPYTDAWKSEAPDEDAIWEFHDSVPAVPDPDGVTVNLGDHTIDLADIRVVAQVDDAELLVDVAVHHPVFAELEGAARQAMTFLPLDATLGERLAARRLRRVETADAEPDGAITLNALRILVQELDERGDDSVGDAG